MKTIDTLRNSLPQVGQVEWLGIRPERRAPMLVRQEIRVDAIAGISGDRYRGRTGVRHVTLIQAEHLPVISGVSGNTSVTPELLRRNIVVSGLNLLALRERTIRIGSAELRVTGLCHPCSRMEELLGPGGYNAVRGHGGVTAQVLVAGTIALGDQVADRPDQQQLPL